MFEKETNCHSHTGALILSHVRYLLVALLIPGLSIDSIAGYLPSIGHILANLLRVAVPLTPLAIMLCCKAHCVLLTNRNISGCGVSCCTNTEDVATQSNR